MSDAVNRPAHYVMPDGTEVIQISRWLTSNGGQAVGYIARATRTDGVVKGDPVEDIRKAIRLLEDEADRLAQARLERNPHAVEAIKAGDEDEAAPVALHNPSRLVRFWDENWKHVDHTFTDLPPESSSERIHIRVDPKLASVIRDCLNVTLPYERTAWRLEGWKFEPDALTLELTNYDSFIRECIVPPEKFVKIAGAEQ